MSDKESYQSLLQFSERLDSEFALGGNRLFYFSDGTTIFGVISDYLKSSGLTQTTGFKRLVIENHLAVILNLLNH